MKEFNRILVLISAFLAAIVSPQVDPPTRDAVVPTAAEIAERFRDKVNSAEKKIVIEMTEDVTYYEMNLQDSQVGERDPEAAIRQALVAGEHHRVQRVQILTTMTMTPTSLVSEIFRHDISDQPVTIVRLTEDKSTSLVFGVAEAVQPDGSTKTKRFNLSSLCDEDWMESASLELGNPATSGLPVACGANIEAWLFWRNCWANDLAQQISKGEVQEDVLNGRKVYKVVNQHYKFEEEDEKGRLDFYYGANTYFLDVDTGLLTRRENVRIHNRAGQFQSGLSTTRTYEWGLVRR